MITKQINPFLEKKLRSKFKYLFPKRLNCSVLITYKSIFQKPDLIFFEYSNSGQQLYGEKIAPISLGKVSRFECFRNILYRSCFFLDLFTIEKNRLLLKEQNTEDFLYAYSKIIFAIGEVKLLLAGAYTADNFKRNENLKNIDAVFSKEHDALHQFRYYQAIPEDFTLSVYQERAIEYLAQIYNELFSHLISKTKLKEIHPNITTRIINKLLFLKSYWQKYHILEYNSEEDFIVFILKHAELIKKLREKKSVTQEELLTVLRYWRTAGWFYFPL
ncbi:MAG: hypothetical protein H6767_09830 [Candidatus Peribacteria bacterium]|nr:MAG: hypothetical protein H6767_09830 [Candidatus Peribacteria bacterium]